jgi:dipeptidyl-peptidase-4
VRRTVVVASARLVPTGGSAPLEIDDYAWSTDAKRLLIFTNTRKVWRQNTRGDYWVLDLAAGSLKKLGGGAPESSLMFAKFSPDGTRTAYVRGNNIYVERLDDGQVAQLTKDGSDTTINGTSDWVYEEELDVRDGFRWSPDGTLIAFWQFDTTGVGVFTLLNNTKTLYPEITKIPYPKAGTRIRQSVSASCRQPAARPRWLKTPATRATTTLHVSSGSIPARWQSSN